MIKDLASRIMQYEGGDMSEEDTLALFQELVDNGMAWTLHGSYGRTAESLLRAGLIFDADTHRAYQSIPQRFRGNIYAAGEVLDKDWDEVA